MLMPACLPALGCQHRYNGGLADSSTLGWHGGSRVLSMHPGWPRARVVTTACAAAYMNASTQATHTGGRAGAGAIAEPAPQRCAALPSYPGAPCLLRCPCMRTVWTCLCMPACLLQRCPQACPQQAQFCRPRAGWPGGCLLMHMRASASHTHRPPVPRVWVEAKPALPPGGVQSVCPLTAAAGARCEQTR